MRKNYLLLGVAALALAGCNGAGLQSAGSTAATPPSTTVDPGPGTGVSFIPSGSIGANGNTTTGSSNTFLSGTSAQTLNAVGGLQSLQVDQATGGQVYAGDAATVRSPSGTIAYDPRDGIFTLTLADTKADVNTSFNFQDPLHRTDVENRQAGVPPLNGFNYLQGVGSDNSATTSDQTTLFYQRPGDSTTYVSLAGYVRNSVPSGTTGTAIYERGAMVFGQATSTSQIPTTGTGTYQGGMLATMTAGVLSGFSNGAAYSSSQWIAGTSSVSVDFGKNSVALGLDGTVGLATFQNQTVDDKRLLIPSGSTFAATGTATIDLVKTGGFSGAFQSASFKTPNGTVAVDFTSAAAGSSTAGASSIDGTFYGPNAVNLGGSFRIVGGVPNQRVDILGAFTGAKTGN